MQDHLPRKRRGWEHLVRIGRMAGECNRLTDLPLDIRRWSINKCRGRGVSSRDRDAGNIRRSLIVCHFELDVVQFRLCVGERGLGRQGIAEAAVAVQVP